MSGVTVETVERKPTGRGTSTLYTVRSGDGAHLVVSVMRLPGERISRVAVSVITDVGERDVRWIRDVLTTIVYAPGAPFTEARNTTQALTGLAAEMSAETARWVPRGLW